MIKEHEQNNSFVKKRKQNSQNQAELFFANNSKALIVVNPSFYSGRIVFLATAAAFRYTTQYFNKRDFRHHSGEPSC